MTCGSCLSNRINTALTMQARVDEPGFGLVHALSSVLPISLRALWSPLKVAPRSTRF